jgi:predicted nucleotide-binding protein
VLLSDAATVPQAIKDSNAGRPMNRILLADALHYSPSSSGFRDKIMAAFRYGLIDGNYKSETIALTNLGVALTAPRNDSERIEALRRAFLQVPIFKQLVDHFANAKVPDPAFLKNTLERDPFDVDPAWSAEIAELFAANAALVGLLRDMNGSRYLVLEAGALPETVDPTPDPSATESVANSSTEHATPPSDPSHTSTAPTTPPAPATAPAVPMQVFIAHGRNRKPLDQLKKILSEWQVPYVVAVDEAHAGRPISEKVADLMRACTAGIFIFTADDEFHDAAGTSVYRPSQNVIFELGAAALLYGRKIVLVKETGVVFPTDFNDLGWIEFEKDQLDAKAMELLREMIALKAVRLVSATSG